MALSSQEKKKERSLMVVKGNEVVQKARYKLDLEQQKIILYLISKIDSVKDESLPNVSVDLKDLCEIMGITYTGMNLKTFKNKMQALADKSMWVESDDKIRLMRWLQRVDINKGSTTVSVEFDDLMAPYLLKIKNNFTQYKLINVLPMRSQYSLRMYELIKSHEAQGKWTVPLKDLKGLLFIDCFAAYDRYDLFRQRVLDPSIREICDFTDIFVAYSTKRENRKVSYITFEMCTVHTNCLRYTEGKRRDINQEIILDRLNTPIVPIDKIPSVSYVRRLKEAIHREKRGFEIRKQSYQARKDRAEGKTRLNSYAIAREEDGFSWSKD